MKLERTRIRRKRWDLDTHDFRRIESMMEKKKKKAKIYEERNSVEWKQRRLVGIERGDNGSRSMPRSDVSRPVGWQGRARVAFRCNNKTDGRCADQWRKRKDLV